MSVVNIPSASTAADRRLPTRPCDAPAVSRPEQVRVRASPCQLDLVSRDPVDERNVHDQLRENGLKVLRTGGAGALKLLFASDFDHHPDSMLQSHFIVGPDASRFPLTGPGKIEVNALCQLVNHVAAQIVTDDSVRMIEEPTHLSALNVLPMFWQAEIGNGRQMGGLSAAAATRRPRGCLRQDERRIKPRYGAGKRKEPGAKMCNLYSNTTVSEAMRRLFQVDASRDRLGNARPRPAIFPKGTAPVVALDDDGNRELVEMSWGFRTPKVSKKTGKPIKPLAWNNARDDKLLKSGLWKASFAERRCLVPVSSFSEMKGKKPATDFWFALTGEREDDRPPFAVAGLWRRERDDLLDPEHPRCVHTMVTTEATDLIRPIHARGRMLVILRPEDHEIWLKGSTGDAMALLKPFPSEEMRIVRQGVGIKKDDIVEIGT